MRVSLALVHHETEIVPRHIESTRAAYEAFAPFLSNLAQEKTYALLLNHHLDLLHVTEVSSGGMAECMVDPKVLFSTCLLAGATKLIIAHNHPTGNLDPSQADISMTRQVVQGGRILYIDVCDHLIIGVGKFTSMKARHPDIFEEPTWR